MSDTQHLFFNGELSPLGRLITAGLIENTAGRPDDHSSLRVISSYAIIYVYEGSGEYRDGRKQILDVSAGDLMVIFPETPHKYGPSQGGMWSEIYCLFEGPVFDFWRDKGLLNPHNPILHLQPAEQWKIRLLDFYRSGATGDLIGISRFLQLLAEMVSLGHPRTAGPAPDWVTVACTAIEADLSHPPDMQYLAYRLGMSRRNFYKLFTQEMGVPPGVYRNQRRIAAAQEVLRHSTATNREVARRLGYSSEHHFSASFKKFTGESSRQFRKKLALEIRPAS